MLLHVDEWAPPSARRRLFESADDTGGRSALVVACLTIFVSGGLPYGISALFPVMFSEGILAAQRCGVEKARMCVAEQRSTKCCDAQMLSYTLISSTAMIPSDSLVAVYGELVDRKGPRFTFALGMLCACVGLAVLAANLLLHSEPLWFVAFALLGSSGPGIFFSILFLSETYPALQPLIAALCSATFDASAICFYIWNALYFRAGFSLGAIATTWLGVCTLCALATWRWLPTWRWLKAERLRAKSAELDRSRVPSIDTRQDSACSDCSTSSQSLLDRSSKSLLSDLSNTGSSVIDAGLSSTRSLLEGGVVTFGASGMERAVDKVAPVGAGEPATPPRSVDDNRNHVYNHDDQHDGALIAPTPPITPNAHLIRALQLSYHAGYDGTESESSVSGGMLCVPPHDASASSRIAEAAPAAATGAVATDASPSRPPLSSTHHYASPTSPAVAAPRLVDQMLRIDTLLLLLTMSCANLKATYYIVSFSDELRSLFDEETAHRLDSLFNVAFPVGALLTSPIASRLLRRYRKQPHAYMFIALLGQHVFGFCTLLPYVAPQAIGALLFGPARTMLWGAYFHYLAEPRRYPRQLAGRTLGYSNLLLAVTSDAPLYAINLLVETLTADGGAPRRAELYRCVHLTMQALLLVCLTFPLHLYRTRHCKMPAHAQSRSSEQRHSGYEPPPATNAAESRSP